MDTLSYKTISANSQTVEKEWLLVDAENEILGRLASKVARIIRGKHKTNFTPHVDCGDNVVIINADKILLTGTKMATKKYIRYSGYPGGQSSLTAQQIMDRKPEIVLEKAIKGMLPKNKLGSALFRNLKVYAGAEHNQAAQQPRAININDIK